MNTTDGCDFIDIELVLMYLFLVLNSVCYTGDSNKTNVVERVAHKTLINWKN